MSGLRVIKKPLVTEKTSKMVGPSRDGEALSVVAFRVDVKASKRAICEAVEGLFGVSVDSVRTQTMPSRTRRVGRFVGKQGPWKKAIVTLAKGSQINFFGEV